MTDWQYRSATQDTVHFIRLEKRGNLWKNTKLQQPPSAPRCCWPRSQLWAILLSEEGDECECVASDTQGHRYREGGVNVVKRVCKVILAKSPRGAAPVRLPAAARRAATAARSCPTQHHCHYQHSKHFSYTMQETWLYSSRKFFLTDRNLLYMWLSSSWVIWRWGLPLRVFVSYIYICYWKTSAVFQALV